MEIHTGASGHMSIIPLAKGHDIRYGPAVSDSITSPIAHPKHNHVGRNKAQRLHSELALVVRLAYAWLCLSSMNRASPHENTRCNLDKAMIPSLSELATYWTFSWPNTKVRPYRTRYKIETGSRPLFCLRYPVISPSFLDIFQPTVAQHAARS